MRHLSIYYALGAIALGVVGLCFHDFALQWQPVPKGMPARDLLSIVSGLVLVFLGGAILVRRALAPASFALGSFYALWVVGLHLPRIVAAPDSLVTWLGAAEIAALVAGGGMLYFVERGGPVVARRPLAVLFGASALVFGLSHFVYAQFTAGMVPGWISAPLFWAYATGCGHCLAGISIASGVLARVAATAMAAMCAGFALLLHVPRVLADPGNHAEWTMLCIAVSIGGAAWIMRESARSE
ncbi:MAG: hypothetical protein ABI411_00600 [Tahibacter sp.]